MTVSCVGTWDVVMNYLFVLRMSLSSLPRCLTCRRLLGRSCHYRRAWIEGGNIASLEVVSANILGTHGNTCGVLSHLYEKQYMWVHLVWGFRGQANEFVIRRCGLFGGCGATRPLGNEVNVRRFVGNPWFEQATFGYTPLAPPRAERCLNFVEGALNMFMANKSM